MFTGLKRIGQTLSLMALLFFLYPTGGDAAVLPYLDVDFHLGSGYRIDNLKWNIAGMSDGTSPNILSELTWSDIASFQLKGQVRAVLLEKIYLRGYFQGGWILSGQVQDSDFHGDDRTLEFSRSDNVSDNGNVWDISSAIGYRNTITVFSGTLELVPLAGYSFHKQNLVLTDGFQAIPNTGPFPGLDSTFSARWYGPWLGADLSYAILGLVFRASAEYHYFFYRGLGNWNLRTDFAHPTSFRHTAQGSGVLVATGLEYHLTDGVRLSLDIEYNKWETNPGNDRTFFADGKVLDTQLNVVNWNSASVMMDLSWRF